MLFPSEVFLFLFLPFVLAVYYLVLRKHTVGKNVFLIYYEFVILCIWRTKICVLNAVYDSITLWTRFINQ